MAMDDRVRGSTPGAGKSISVYNKMMMMMMKLPILPCAEKRASFVYRTKNVDNNDKDSKNRKQSH